jgi:hypothetical protein
MCDMSVQSMAYNEVYAMYVVCAAGLEFLGIELELHDINNSRWKSNY